MNTASHDRLNYATNNTTVLDILEGCLGDSEHLTSLKTFQKARNGCGALLPLETQNLGNSKWDMLITRVEQTVLKFSCRHIVSHCAAHNDMFCTSENTPYQPHNGHKRVVRLLNNIVSTIIKFVSAAITILTDAAKREYFWGCCQFYPTCCSRSNLKF